GGGRAAAHFVAEREIAALAGCGAIGRLRALQAALAALVVEPVVAHRRDAGRVRLLAGPRSPGTGPQGTGRNDEAEAAGDAADQVVDEAVGPLVEREAEQGAVVAHAHQCRQREQLLERGAALLRAPDALVDGDA